MLRGLKRDHKLILTILGRVERMLDDARTPDIIQLGEERWEFSRLIDEHLRAKEMLVCRALRAGRAAADVRTARQLLGLARILTASCAEHARSWTPQRIVAETGRYRTETRALIAEMRALVAEEQVGLYPILAAPPHRLAARQTTAAAISLSGTLVSAS